MLGLYPRSWGPETSWSATGKEECRTVARGMVTANNRATMHLSRLLLLALAVAACRDATGGKQQPAPAPYAGSAIAQPAGSGSGSGMFVPQQKAPDTPPGTNPDYVPAEFKSGMARWKDVGVYVDGKPLAFMTFGELPITLKPTFVKDKVSDNKPPGCPLEKCPGWKWCQMRFYKFTDYLKALGVDIKRVEDDARLRPEVLADDRGDVEGSAVEGGRRVHVPVRNAHRRQGDPARARRTSATASSPTRSTA